MSRLFGISCIFGGEGDCVDIVGELLTNIYKKALTVFNGYNRLSIY